MRKNLSLFQSVAIIVGTIIGAGILGIPYVVAQSGFLTGALMIVIIGLAMMMVKLFFAETALRTKTDHQLLGFTGIYFGKNFKRLQMTWVLLGMNGSILAYLIGEGEILSSLLPGSPVLWTSVFFIVFGFMVFKGLNIIKQAELIMTMVIFAALYVIGLYSAPHIDFSFLNEFHLFKVLIPYGVLIYALGGLIAIPEVEKVLAARGQRGLMKWAIILGTIVPIIIYIVFAALVVGVTGSGTTEIATIGLGNVLGREVLIIGNIFAFFTIATSFLTYSLALVDTYEGDYKMSHKFATILALGVPFLFFAFGIRDFITVISILGAVGGGLSYILIILIFWRARKRGDTKPAFSIPTWVAKPLSVIFILMFIGGIISVFF